MPKLFFSITLIICSAQTYASFSRTPQELSSTTRAIGQRISALHEEIRKERDSAIKYNYIESTNKLALLRKELEELNAEFSSSCQNDYHGQQQPNAAYSHQEPARDQRVTAQDL